MTSSTYTFQKICPRSDPVTRLLIKLFIRDSENTGSEAVRMRLGVLSRAVGIALNDLKCLFNLIFG